MRRRDFLRPELIDVGIYLGAIGALLILINGWPF